jgi:UDP-N-acetylglucosamine 1-carboxyvinyltransferase
VQKLRVSGPVSLQGKVAISGAKNAALPILLATILCDGPVVLHNVPLLRDTTTVLALLTKLGARVVMHDGGAVEIDTSTLQHFAADYDLVKTMRASVLVLGPLLAKYHEAYVSLPGGCAIGSRPVDLHLRGLTQLGADITLHDGYIDARSAGRLRGAVVDMPVISVGATENILMAATLAEGTTTLSGAATEPEVIDLANFLVAMGAKISGIGTSCMTIEGVRSLQGGAYTVIPDRVEAGTYLIAAAMTRGAVRVEQVVPEDLSMVCDLLQQAGANIVIEEAAIGLDMQGRAPHAVSIQTAPFPGFPTDLQAQWLAMATVSEGVAQIEETVFENRFMHVQELCRMGAQIELHGRVATVTGQPALSGAPVMATDLRASASLVLAGLVAQGDTLIDRIYHIDRGYSFLEEKFGALGAIIERVS